MNKDNVQLLIDALKQELKAKTRDVGFNMNWWTIDKIDLESFENSPGLRGIKFKDLTGNSCGTTACLGGWCNILSGFAELSLSEGSTNANAREFLGLDEDGARTLFYPPMIKHYDDITPQDAIEVLEHLRDTGIVNWALVAGKYGAWGDE